METKEFEQIAPELRRRSLAAARSIGLDADQAEDVAQDVLLRLWTLRVEIAVGRAPAFASVAARNAAVDVQRRRHTVPMPDRPMLDDRHTQPDAVLETADDERWLESRMRALPSTEYQVLHLRQVERRTDQEIAAILGISAASVSTLLSRARRKLLEAVRRRSR